MFDFRDHVLTTSVAVALTLVIAILTFWGLATLSRSDGLAFQVAAARNDLKILHQLEKVRPKGSAYALGTVCHGDPAAAAVALRQRVTAASAASAASGANLVRVFAAPGRPRADAPDLVSVALNFEARGGQDAVLGLLGNLASGTPVVFAERAEITSQITQLTLKVKGEVLCSSHATS